MEDNTEQMRETVGVGLSDSGEGNKTPPATEAEEDSRNLGAVKGAAEQAGQAGTKTGSGVSPVSGKGNETPRAAEGEGSSAEEDNAKQTSETGSKTRGAVSSGFGGSNQTPPQGKEGFAAVGTKQFFSVLLFNLALAIALVLYLTWFWGKSSLRIEYASEDFFSSSLNIQKFLEPLLKDTELTDRLRKALNKTPTCGSEAQRVGWLDVRNLSGLTYWPVDDNCASLVIKAADTVLWDLKEQRTSTTLAGESENNRLQSLRDLRSEMQRIEEQNQKRLTGRVDFLVGVLNAGNSDNVIKDYATLEWRTEENEEHPKKLSLYACRFTLLKEHSFQQIRFIVDRDPKQIVDRDQKENDLKEWEQCVRNRKAITYTIILNSEKEPLTLPGTLFKYGEAPRRAIAARSSRDCESLAP